MYFEGRAKKIYLLKDSIWCEKKREKLKMTPRCLARAIGKVGLHLSKMAMSIRNNVYKEKVWREMNNLVSHRQLNMTLEFR